MLAALSNTKWGWKKQQLTQVYNAHIKSILDYGAHCYQPWLSETNKLELERLQNSSIRLITGHMAKTPVAALNAETGLATYQTVSKRLILTANEKAHRCPPNHPSRTAAESVQEIHRLKRSNFVEKSKALANHLPPNSGNRLPLDFSTTPPWESNNEIIIIPTLGDLTKSSDPKILKSATMKMLEEETADLFIYTDGSATEGTVNGGSAAVITRGDQAFPEVLETIKSKGRSCTSSYEEEQVALELAKDWIEAYQTDTILSILICTDSKSLCDALACPETGRVAKLKLQLSKLKHRIKIHWIPGHVDIPGNELADSAAKEATLAEGESEPLSFASVKAYIKKSITDGVIPHDRVRNAYSGYKLKNDAEVKSRADQTLLARVRSGHHLAFRNVQHEFDNSVDPTCPHCPGQEHNLTHWLTSCERTTAARMRLFGTLDVPLSYLARFPKQIVQMSKETLFF